MTLALFGAKVLTTLKGAEFMNGCASMYNTVSCTGAKAAGTYSAHFCGYTYADFITVSTAAAVLIFIARLIIMLNMIL